MTRDRTAHGLAQELADTGIRPTPQRILVLGYLRRHLVHPTAARIYIDLKARNPTISKATVYNALETFRSKRLVRVLALEGSENRFDVQLSPHGHFRCDTCGMICDFEIPVDDFHAEELEGFRVEDKNVYFRGVCPDCLKKGQ